jgi:hypothetical protein
LEKAAGACGGCGGYLWDFNRFSPESPAEAEFSKKAFIDGNRFCHIDLVWESAHRNPRLDHFSSSQFVESPMRLGSGTR